MIVSKLEINLSDEGNEVEIGRKVILDGEREEIVRDLKAIGCALAESARRRKLEEPKESAERIQFEQALAEGFRMDADEAKEMDRAAAEEIEEKISEECADIVAEETAERWRA